MGGEDPSHYLTGALGAEPAASSPATARIATPHPGARRSPGPLAGLLLDTWDALRDVVGMAAGRVLGLIGPRRA